MESNHHKQIQSLRHYHYANPQLLKIISFYVFLYNFFWRNVMLHLLFYRFWFFVYNLFYYVMIYMAYIYFL